MTAWTGEVGRRIDGHPARQPLEGDWPAPSGVDEAAWQRDVQALIDAHDRLLTRVATLSDAALHAPPAENRDRRPGPA